MAAKKKPAAKQQPVTAARKSSIAVDLQTGLVTQVALRDVHPDPDQPRKVFDEKTLAALAANIKARGIYLPILVRYVDGKVTIIDGERRWRAAKLAGLKTVPVLLQDTGTYEAEALQADQVGLNQLGERLRPMEIARTLRAWRDAGKTPNEIAKLLADMGHAPMKPAAIAELAGLTDLPEWAQGMIDRDELAAGPAALVVDAVAIPGVEKHLRKALEQDVGYRGTLTARDVKGRVGDALHTIATDLTVTESWYGYRAVHFAWKERCRNCEHLVKWDGAGYCLSKKLFTEHQAEAKAAGLGPGGKRPEKPRDAAGRITTPEKAAAEAAELKNALRERSLGEKVRDYLHAHLLQFIARYIQKDDLPHPNPVEQSLLIWSALKKPGAFGGRSAPGVAYGELRVDAAQHCKVTGLEDLLRTHDEIGAMEPNPEREAVLQLLTELEWRETHVLARHLFGKDLTAVWRLNGSFLDLFRKAELAHLATTHGCELPEGRRSWDALKTDQLKAALLDQEAKLARPQILVDLYEGEIEKPHTRGGWKGLDVDAEDETVCIGCGCTQTDPCEEGCGWKALDFDNDGRDVGVCDSPDCAQHLERFDEGDFTLSEQAKARVAERAAFRGQGQVTEFGEGSDAEDLEAVEGEA
jgi:ParB/RepB/Spo0J family partition protein